MAPDFPTLLCTGNPKKADEWNAICAELSGQGVPLLGTKKPAAEPIEIESGDYVQVAVEKAVSAYLFCDNTPVLVENTGFGIDGLGGFPGPLYKTIERQIGRPRLVKIAQENVNMRHGPPVATATTTIAFYVPEQREIRIVRADVQGRIPYKEAGGTAFGFDTIFIPRLDNTDLRTYSLMEPEEKNKISMRRLAIEKLLKGYWESYPVTRSSLCKFL